jgi:hypothetical protein
MPKVWQYKPDSTQGFEKLGNRINMNNHLKAAK